MCDRVLRISPMPKVDILVPRTPQLALFASNCRFQYCLKPPHVERMAAEPAGLHGWRA
jgi:hypothetical protein